MAALFLVAGIRPYYGGAAEKGDDPIKMEAAEALQRIIKGIYEGDYELFTSRFSPALKKAQDREAFLQLQKSFQKKLGKFVSMEYLGFYEQYNSTIALFKARFTKEKDDVLIRLVLDKPGSNPTLTGLWFDSLSIAR
jgi:hypothetical protein